VKTEAESSIDIFEGIEGSLRNLRVFSKQLRERRSATPSVFVLHKPVNQKVVKGHFRALADKLCADHPTICTDGEVLGGKPHIKDTRLSVGTVLAKLYVYGSIASVVENYGPHLSEEQVKAALAYAQDFLEIACDEQEAT